MTVSSPCVTSRVFVSKLPSRPRSFWSVLRPSPPFQLKKSGAVAYPLGMVALQSWPSSLVLLSLVTGAEPFRIMAFVLGQLAPLLRLLPFV